MSTGFLDLLRTFNSHRSDAAIGLVGKRGITEPRCERTALPVVLAYQGVSFIHASRIRTTAFRHFCEEQNGNAAVAVAALAFTRHSSVAVCARSNNSGLEVLGRRLQCRCISEIPTEGDNLYLQAPTSSDDAGSDEESVESTSDQPVFQDLQIDLNLPRRRMLVEFTCNVCDSRTQRLISPEAYRSGTIFVQCAGCEVYHQLVDNLNLIQEFDFRKENGSTGKES